MSDFEQYVPEYLRAMNSYSPGKSLRQAEKESGIHCIKLASNENPFGPSPLALDAMRRAEPAGNFYPDADSSELRQRLTERHDLQLEQVMVTAGSTQFLDIIARTLLRPGLNAVTSQHSFIVYELVTRATGARLLQTPARNHGFDLEAIAAAVNPDTRIVFLSNPNNPTGTMFDADATEKLLKCLPDHVLVVLDEAYCDFAQAFARQRGVEYSRSLASVREGGNLVVLRTFSKAHGLAGIRVGYGFGPAPLLRHFVRVRPAFSVSCIAEAAALAAMDDHAHVAKAVENNLQQAPWMQEQLKEAGFDAISTSANFICIETGEDAAALAQRIQQQGVIVRALTAWGMPTSIRVTIGTPEQNQQFLAVLKNAGARAVAR